MPKTIPCPNEKQWSVLRTWDADHAFSDDFAHHVESCSACASQVELITKSHFVGDILRAETHDELLDQAHLVTVISRLKQLVNAPATMDRANGLPTWSLAPSAVDTEYVDRGETHSVKQDVGDLGDDLHFTHLHEYRLIRKLDQGGMGAVFEGYDENLNRPVGIKIISRGGKNQTHLHKRFVIEGQSLAAVRSQHIVDIYRSAEDHGVRYLAMELLVGANLDDWLAARTEPITTADIVWFADDALAGLVDMHGAGLVHRDIKPGNLWIDKASGRVKIIDFGLARQGEDSGLTPSQAIIGTPAYMSPEQARGEKADHRSDLFSLGVVLYRICTGCSPFQREPMTAALAAVANFDPPMDKIPPEVRPIIARLLAKKPVARYQTAAEARAAVLTLRKALQEASTQTLPQPVKPRFPKAITLALALGAVCVAVLFGVIIILRDSSGRQIRVEIPENIAKNGTVEIIDTKAGKKTVVPFGSQKPEPKKINPASKEVPREIIVGATITIVTEDKTPGYADNSSDAAHDQIPLLSRGMKGEVLAVDEANNRCRIRLVDRPNIDDLWVSLDRVERLK